MFIPVQPRPTGDRPDMARVSGSYLLKRVLMSVVVLWVLLTFLFFLLKAMPGDMATLLLNPNLEPTDLQALMHEKLI